jgi:prepilin peptidase CpaA
MNMNSEFHAALELLSILVLDPHKSVLIGLLLIAAWSDCKTQRIPNLLVFGGTAFGLIFNWLFPPMRDAEFMWALQGLGTGLALMLPFYFLRAMGAGDVKLMAMVGAFTGPVGAFVTVFAASIVGAVVGLALIPLRRGTLQDALPFGCFLAPASLVALLWGPRLVQAYGRLVFPSG